MTTYEHVLNIVDLGAEKTVRLSPDEGQRQDISERLELVGLPSFSAMMTVTPLKKNRVLKVTGTVTAELTQECVVTLEPFDARIETTFTEIHDRDADSLGGDDDDVDPTEAWEEAAEVPEFLDGDTLDLADIAVQHLCLALDPFPRKPGASLESAKKAGISVNEPERANPFAALQALKGEEAED